MVIIAIAGVGAKQNEVVLAVPSMGTNEGASFV